MWLTPQEIEDKCLVTCNETYVSYLPLSSSIFPYLLKSSLYFLGYRPLSPVA